LSLHLIVQYHGQCLFYIITGQLVEDIPALSAEEKIHHRLIGDGIAADPSIPDIGTGKPCLCIDNGKALKLIQAIGILLIDPP